MFEWKDILILGDSFAEIRIDALSWPNILCKRLTENSEPPRGVGYPGCSWWSVRKKLIEELQECVPKVLIICHSEASRIPSDIDLPLNAGTTTEDFESYCKNDNLNIDFSAYKLAAKMYYKYLMSDEYHIWAREKWFLELDSITKLHAIPYVVHLQCFNTIKQHVFENGMDVEETLWESSTHYKQWIKNNASWINFVHTIPIINHFSIEENQLLSDCLFNAVNNYSVGKQKIGLLT